MTKRTFILTYLFILFCLAINAQIHFEPGYFINNNDEKISCLIKDKDWKYNPTSFEYKTGETAKVNTVDIQDAKEVRIDGISIYRRHTVNIDRSSEQTSQLSLDKNPKFKEETLFLQVLIEGPATLYLYEDVLLTRFFYKTNEVPLQQLVWKSYKTANRQIRENVQYKQDLINNLQCDEVSKNMILSTSYKEKSLKKLFSKYNSCIDPNTIVFEKKDDKQQFKYGLIIGFNTNSFEALHIPRLERFRKEEHQGLSFGIQGEYIMPFMKNKISFIIQPSYHHTKYEGQSSFDQLYKVDYKFIDLPVGVRYSMFLNDQTKIFVAGYYVNSINFESSFIVDSLEDVEINTQPNLAASVGIQIKDKYSFELKYNTSREVVNLSPSVTSSHRNIGLFICYTIN